LRRAQVVFVIDTTGSMNPVLDALKEAIFSIARIYANFRIKSEFGLIEFRHIPSLSSGEALRRVSFPPPPTNYWTEDDSTFSEQVTNLVAQGGGQFRESINEALKEASNSDWDSKTSTKRVILLVTDSKPDQNYLTTEEVVEYFTAAGIDQFYTLSDPRYFGEYDILSEAQVRGDGGDITVHQLPLESPLDVEKINNQFKEFAEHSGYGITTSVQDTGDDGDGDDDSTANSGVIGT